MDIYGKITNLHGSDRHVLNKYKSEFYEYSPESIQTKKPNDTDTGLYNNTSNAAVLYAPQKQVK